MSDDDDDDDINDWLQGFQLRFYMIDKDHKITYTLDAIEWSEWFQVAYAADHTLRRVARTTLSDGSIISTVFLGVDYNFHDKGPPILFESAVLYAVDSTIDDNSIDIERRYATWAEAEIGHMELCEKLNYALLSIR